MLLPVEFPLPSLTLALEPIFNNESRGFIPDNISGDAGCKLPLLLPLRLVINVAADSDASIPRPLTASKKDNL